MVKVRKVGFFTVVLASVLFAGSGCSPEQLQQIDRAVADANTIGQGIAAISDGPAGVLIPPEIRAIMVLLGVGAAAAYEIWQRIRLARVLERNQDLDVTLRALGDGIDQASPKAADDVKAQILAVMMQRRIYDKADRVVDEHRAKKTAAA